ncbi:MAG TPA: LysR substrate-binding domain-containing protein, partial [Aestuariivirga sp.]|nr:LysR substrate-binding domain-containing protein [Aestuariivirga sp.]
RGGFTRRRRAPAGAEPPPRLPERPARGGARGGRAVLLERGRQHHFAHAGLAIEAALHGFGVALGDSMTAPHLLARGQLVTPFALSVPAVDDFYIACRNDLRHTPIVDAFISWLFREIEEERSRAAVAATPRPAAASQRPAASRKPAAPKKKRRRP